MKPTNKISDEFLQTDLVICSTFVEIAKQEISSGERDFAERIIDRAEEVYAASVGKHFAGVENGCHRRGIEQKLIVIRERLDALKIQMKRLAA